MTKLLTWDGGDLPVVSIIKMRQPAIAETTFHLALEREIARLKQLCEKDEPYATKTANEVGRIIDTYV